MAILAYVQGVLVLGCGYTAMRVATRLRARGVPVIAGGRRAAALAPLVARGGQAVAFDAARPATWPDLARAAASLGPGYRLLVSFPPVALDPDGGPATAPLLAALPAPSRIVYISSTGVYGAALAVDAATPADPVRAEDLHRLEAERAVAAAAPSSLVLRAAAIYGPDRGLHVPGGPRRALDPDRLVSRIHADDLAALCDAALLADLGGTYPVADLEPASARTIAAFCASLGIAVPLPEPGDAARHGGRRVDGRAVLARLGVRLAYPTYREGIRAAVDAGFRAIDDASMGHH